MFQKLCGQKALVNVLLTTTQWSDVDPTKAQHRENELRSQKFWGDLICRGATLQRFYGTRESGLELIHKLMPNIPKSLDIQDEMGGGGVLLRDTEAGKYISQELRAQEKKHKEEIESLKKEFLEVIKAKDDEMHQILAAEQAKFQEKLDDVAAELKWFMKHEVRIPQSEAEKRRRREKGMIAVATKDIPVTAHIASLFGSFSTGGRWILDINDEEEFESDTFMVKIQYQFNILFLVQIPTKTLMEIFDEGMGGTNHIYHKGVRYECKSSTINRGGQKFIIFSRS